MNGGLHAEHLSPASSHESISSLSTASTSGSNNQQKEGAAAANPSVAVIGAAGLLLQEQGSTPSASSLNVTVTPLPSSHSPSLRVSAQATNATEGSPAAATSASASTSTAATSGNGSGSDGAHGTGASLSIAESVRRERNLPPLASFRKPVLPPPPPPTPAPGLDQPDQLVASSATGREHAFEVKNFYVTQKCAYCSSILFGQQRQGLACNSALLLANRRSLRMNCLVMKIECSVRCTCFCIALVSL